MNARNQKGRARLTLPNTIGVGFGRSATTYVSHVLSEHPEVCFSSQKETAFFNRHYGQGLRAYSQYFEHCRGRRAKILAEWSPGYILDEDNLRRIRDSLSDGVKLLVIYRNPVAALESALRHRLARGQIDGGRRVRELVESNWYLVEHRHYDVHLARLFDIFPEQQVLVMRFEDMGHDQPGFFRALYKFLGIQYVPVHELVPHMNVTRITRSLVIQALLYRLVRLFRGDRQAKRILKAHPAEQSRWLRTVQGWNTKPTDLAFDPALHEELEAHFAPHMRRLETMLRHQRKWAGETWMA